MTLKTPTFWYCPDGKTSLLASALWPASKLYQSVHSINQSLKKPYNSSVPVICVGNATAGGSGKTPSCIALARLLNNPGLYFLTRGYKGGLKQTIMVDTNIHLSRMVGDESLLLARYAPTIKSADRVKGLHLAEAQNADMVIMDDGLQNNSVHKDLSFMVIDSTSGFGNGKSLPAGPLREPLGKAFAKTDAFILIGEDKRNIKNLLPANKPVFSAKVMAEKLPDMKKVVAFCGLGLPDKFKRTLEESGIEIIGWHVFPDHHAYSHDELEKLVKDAKQSGAALITTEKDAIRISEQTILDQIRILKINVVFDDENALASFIREHLP